MNGYDILYHDMAHELTKHYGIRPHDLNGPSNNLKIQQCKSHFYALLLVEFLLEEHRQKYQASFIDLSGDKALQHMVFQKTNWKIADIDSMTQTEMLFTLIDDLVPEKLSEPSRNYLTILLNNSRLLKVDLSTYDGWKLGSGGRHLTSE